MIKYFQCLFIFVILVYTIDYVLLEAIEYESDIMQLNQNKQTFKYPRNHEDFYYDYFEDEEVIDYESDIMQLTQNMKTFKYPRNHQDFYHDHFEDGGTYGTFDFIIIGAGSAGTLLSNRLSQRSAWKILLLEGGEEDTSYTDIPSMAGLLQFTKYNWAYKSTQQTRCCLGMDEQKCNIPRGKSLGGSSTINSMVYTRGNKFDFDQWAAAGNPGWTYDELLPYFIRMENSSLTENYDPLFHGTNGSLHVEHVKHSSEFGQAFMDANVELGRNILDYNGEEQLGFSRPQLTTINGRRCSGNKAFLAPIRNQRKNLIVQTNAFVIKIIIDEETKVANGVEFVIDNKKYQAFTSKELIVSAGAVGSPHLLMLSGIGPKEHLHELNIPVIQDLPVGRNLADHPFFLQMFHSNFTDPGLKSLDEMINLYQKGKGFLTSAGNFQAIGFVSTENKDYPDIEFIFTPNLVTDNDFMKQGFGFNDETTKVLNDEFPNGGLSVLSILQHPKSRGSITLKSNNPFDHPLIDLNYFEYEDDINVLVASLKDLLKTMSTTESMKRFNISLPITPLPGCKEIPYLTENYWRCAIRYLSSTLHHLMGTCKMGPDTDPEAVVDHELKVKGIKNLRVVDVSIFPMTTSGHTNAPTYMVAEKASDLLIQKYSD